MKTLKESILSQTDIVMTDPHELALLRDKYWTGVEIMEWLDGYLYVKASFYSVSCYNFEEFVRLTGIRSYEFDSPFWLYKCGKMKDIHIVSQHETIIKNDETYDRLWQVESMDGVTYDGLKTSILVVDSGFHKVLQIQSLYTPQYIHGLIFKDIESVKWGQKCYMDVGYLIYSHVKKYPGTLIKNLRSLNLERAIPERAPDLKDRIRKLKRIFNFPPDIHVSNIIVFMGEYSVFCLGSTYEIQNYNPPAYVKFDWSLFPIANNGNTGGIRDWWLAISNRDYVLPQWWLV